MKRAIAVLFMWLGSGAMACGKNSPSSIGPGSDHRPSGSDHRPSGSAAPAESRETPLPNPPATAHPNATTAAPNAGTSRIAKELPADVLEVLRNAPRVAAARMGKEAAERADRTSLIDPSRIAGYPIVGAPRPLSDDDARALGNLLTRDDSYRFDIARRCANDHWVGARFAEFKGDPVEIALGIPCDQLVVSWKADVVRHWGAILTPEASQTCQRLLRL